MVILRIICPITGSELGFVVIPLLSPMVVVQDYCASNLVDAEMVTIIQ